MIRHDAVLQICGPPLWHQVWEDEYEAKHNQPTGRTLGEPQAWSIFTAECFESLFIPMKVAEISEKRVSALSKFLYGPDTRSRLEVARILGLERRSSGDPENRPELVKRQITRAKGDLLNARMIEIYRSRTGSGHVKFVAPHAWFAWGEPPYLREVFGFGAAVQVPAIRDKGTNRDSA